VTIISTIYLGSGLYLGPKMQLLFGGLFLTLVIHSWDHSHISVTQLCVWMYGQCKLFRCCRAHRVL